jgi:hypothetical protein
MEKEIFDTAIKINNDLSRARERIKDYEESRKYGTITLRDYYDNSDRTGFDIDFNGHKEEEEAYQLFLDTLLSIEDKRIEELEKQFKELE